MDILKRLTIALFIALAFAAGSVAPASAQEAQTEFDRLHAECMERDNSRGVGRFIADRLPDQVTDTVESAFCMDSVAGDNPGAAVEEALSNFWDDPVGKFAKAVIEGNTQALEVAMTFWMDMDMSRSALEGTATGVSNIVWWLVVAAFIVNFIILGSRMAWTRRQGLADGLEDAGEMLWQVAFYTVLVPGAIFSIIAASDSLSRAILENFGATTAEDFLSGTAFGDSMAGPILMLAVAGLSFLGSLTQMFAMVARVLLLPLIIGLLPLFAGLGATEWGKAALNSAKNWLIALVLFKPIAALVYSVALWIHNMGGEDEDLLWTITRGLVVAIAGFSVIGVAKIVVPMLSSMGGSNTAAIGGGAVAATGAVAAGAFGAAGAVAGGAGKGMAGAAGRMSAPATGAKGTAGSGGSPTSSASGAAGSSGAAASSPTTAPQTGAGASGSGTAGSSVAGSAGGKQPDAPVPTTDVSTGGKGGQQPGQPSRPEKVGTSMGARRIAGGAAGAGSKVANATAGGARIAQRISKSAGVGGSRAAHGFSAAVTDSLGSPGHGGQINR